MSRVVEEEYRRSRSQRRRESSPMPRDRSPEYYSGGTFRAYDQPVYASGALLDYDYPPQSQPRLAYGPPSPLSPRDTSMTLQVPSSRHRPRSVPPPSNVVVTRRRSRSRRRELSRSSSRSSSDGDGRSRSPIGKARHAIKETFTPTTSGIGVGLLGAVVGGLAAREARDATVRHKNERSYEKGDHHHRPESAKEAQKSRIISTVVGAIVGGLGANALEKRFESARERDKETQEAWERKWGKEDDLPHYDTGREKDINHGRGRTRVQRDADYREDFVVEDHRPRRRRSEDAYYQN